MSINNESIHSSSEGGGAEEKLHKFNPLPHAPEPPKSTEVKVYQTEENKESNPCYFCKTIYEESDKFSCEHNICPKCLFRKIFINNIKEINNIKNNIIIKCKCGKGTLNKTIDEIYQINK